MNVITGMLQNKAFEDPSQRQLPLYYPTSVQTETGKTLKVPLAGMIALRPMEILTPCFD